MAPSIQIPAFALTGLCALPAGEGKHLQMASKSETANAPTIIRAINALNSALGAVAAWLMLPVVLICFTVVILRYAFGTGYVWMQELFIWGHGIAFLSAAAYTFQNNGHVRVDVFYSTMSERSKALVNILGVVVLLFVTCGALFYVSLPQVITSWKLGERSTSLSGLDHAYVLKGFVLVFCVTCILHGIVLLWESWRTLRSPEKGDTA
ncbi:TRAP transporter small permease subunit [Defluviimonas sp. SAOS-178_SWC]|uniref:TRAP transporter small permease subunit n=1 Tax=Defluviimonas sp. SAOS-178_SWC TaxID=3121287 RepID=UPI0032221BBD